MPVDGAASPSTPRWRIDVNGAACSALAVLLLTFAALGFTAWTMAASSALLMGSILVGIAAAGCVWRARRQE